MKVQMWVLVNTKTGKLARDSEGGVGYATRRALEKCFDNSGVTRAKYLGDPKYEIRRVEVRL